MYNPFSDESIEALRKLLEHYKEIECRHWRTVHRRMDVSENRLKHFSTGERVPSAKILGLIFDHLQEFVSDTANAESPVLVIARDECELLFGLSSIRDKYVALKGLANLLDEEQQELSQKAEGTYFALRSQNDGGYFISHILVVDSFLSQGLPTCRISRARRDDVGNIEGDLLIDGAVFTKNRNVSIVGYDRDTGNLRTVTLKPVNNELTKLRGFVSGYELSGTAFSSKVVVQRFPKHTNYKAIREKTGFFPTMEEVQETIVEIFGADHELRERVKVLEEVSYLRVSES